MYFIPHPDRCAPPCFHLTTGSSGCGFRTICALVLVYHAHYMAYFVRDIEIAPLESFGVDVHAVTASCGADVFENGEAALRSLGRELDLQRVLGSTVAGFARVVEKRVSGV
jgi:hypothetical protein